MFDFAFDTLTLALTFAALSIGATMVWAADEPAAQKPAAEVKAAEPEAAVAAAAVALPTVVMAVKGLVQVRQAEEQPWVKAEPGMKLEAGAEFRTGPHSAVEFKVGESQIVKLDRLGTIKVIDAIKQNGKVMTDLGLKYGRSELQVETGGIEHESAIHAPGATLAVRGSVGGIVDDAFETVAYCTNHFAEAHMRGPSGTVVTVPLQERLLTTNADVDPNATAARAIAFNPQQAGTTGGEQMVIAQQPNGTFANRQAGTQGLQQMNKFDTNKDMVTGGLLTMGQLDVSIDFTSVASAMAANVDLRLKSPSGNLIAFNVSDPLGGLHSTGDRSSPNLAMQNFEQITTFSSSEPLQAGTYEAIIFNNGPAAASIDDFGAAAATGGGGFLVIKNLSNLGVLSPGQDIHIPFFVPAKTP
ncbi:MAG: hypothetical protein GC162_09290 [Planctomycetes bacterium]|nr:hypothetical protein [Planctomycetota bacterium]